MVTVRQIERLWTAKAYGRLFRELMGPRAEASLRLEAELARAVPAAAMVLIRLDELSQPHVPLYARLVRFILAAQEPDGGWGDVMTTALCLRALMCSQGQGAGIERGLAYLADLQKSEGIWPNVPLRRMPPDSYVSAFVLYQLGGDLRFRAAVRFGEAAQWFERHQEELDPEARRLRDRAVLRCRMSDPSQSPSLAGAWS